MLIYSGQSRGKRRRLFCLTYWCIAAGCCHYLSATLHLTPGGLCLCVYVRPCVLLSACVCVRARFGQSTSGCLLAFLRMEMSTFAYFCLKVFQEKRLLCVFFNPLRLLLPVCFIWSVCVRCMTCSLRLRRASFCTYVSASSRRPQTSSARFSHILCFTQLISALLRELISRALIPVRPLAGCVNVPCGPLSATID